MEMFGGCRDRTKLRRALKFVDSAFARVVHSSEAISRRAFALVQRHTLSHRIQPVDALVAATELTAKASLATGNVADYRFISGLDVTPYRVIS